MRIASLTEQAQAAHDRRSALYQSYEDAVNKYKSTKDVTMFGTNRKKIDVDHKTLTQQIANIQSKLKTEGADASEKVRSRHLATVCCHIYRHTRHVACVSGWCCVASHLLVCAIYLKSGDRL